MRPPDKEEDPGITAEALPTDTNPASTAKAHGCESTAGGGEAGASTLAGLLAILGRQPDDCVTLSRQAPGGSFVLAGRPRVHHADEVVAGEPGWNWWFNVNPVSRVSYCRDRTEDVTRLSAVRADLDAKDTGCGSMAVNLDDEGGRG